MSFRNWKDWLKILNSPIIYFTMSVSEVGLRWKMQWKKQFGSFEG